MVINARAVVEAANAPTTARSRADGTPWDRHSYRKAWAADVEAISDEHPQVKGMILRDLRKTARTAMTNAGVPEPTIPRVMGHALDVSMSYHLLTKQAATAAILALSVTPGLTAFCGGTRGCRQAATEGSIPIRCLSGDGDGRVSELVDVRVPVM